MDKKNLTINQYNIVGKIQNINFEGIKEYKELECITFRNLKLTDEIIEILNELKFLKKVILVNCKLEITKYLSEITILELIHCKINEKIFSDKIKELYVESCDLLNITGIQDLNLEYLKIEDTKTENLSKIECFTNLRYLYLNEINLDEEINYERLTALKKVNFDGSTSRDYDKIIKQFQNKNIQFSFEKENQRIG